MNFVSVRELRNNSASVWKALAYEKDLVVTSNGRPIAILSETSSEDIEASLLALRQARAQLAVAQMQRDALSAGVSKLSLDEINEEIREVRQRRPQ